MVLSPPSHFYSIKPASQLFLGLTQPLSKVFATAVPTAWNSPSTHTPTPTTKLLPLSLLMSPCKCHLSGTPSLTTLPDGDIPPAGSAPYSCFIFLLGTCSLSFLHSVCLRERKLQKARISSLSSTLVAPATRTLARSGCSINIH